MYASRRALFQSMSALYGFAVRGWRDKERVTCLLPMSKMMVGFNFREANCCDTAYVLVAIVSVPTP